MTHSINARLAALALLLCCVALGAESPGPTSEEYPPVTCDPGAFVINVECTGSYCDNVRIGCGRIQRVELGRSVWTPFVSEEQGLAKCPDNHYIAGLACNGKYCDNLSLHCVEGKNLSVVGCNMTRSISEEQRRVFLGENFVDAAGQRIAARAMRCSGRYCDNKEFEVCEVMAR